MKAIILAGGKGTRLMPLTADRPKPMVKILDAPMLEWGIKLLKKHGFTHICLAVGHLPQTIKDHFGNGKKFGVNIIYSYDVDPGQIDTGKVLGTAGCVKKAAAAKMDGKSFIKDGEDFMVVPGDMFSNIDLKAAYNEHIKNKALATILLKRVDDVTGLGVVKTNSNTVKEFVEKPDPKTFTGDPIINTGVYIFNTKVLSLIPDVLPETGYDFGRTLFPAIVNSADKKLNCVVTDKFWSDLGTIESLNKTAEYVRKNSDKFV